MKKLTKKSKEITPQYDNVRAALRACKGIFGLEFIKRGDGSLRKMQARMKVTKFLRGGVQPFNAKSHNLITVFEMSGGKAIDYKCIPVENIKKLVIDGTEYNF